MESPKLRTALTTSLPPRRRPSHPASTFSPSPTSDPSDPSNVSPGRNDRPLMCISALSRRKEPWNCGVPCSPSQVKMSNGRPLTPSGRWKPLVAFSPCAGGERTREWLQVRKPRTSKDKALRPCFKLTSFRLPSPPRDSSPLRYLQVTRFQPNSLHRRKADSKSSGRRTGEDWKPRPEKILRSSSGISGWNFE